MMATTAKETISQLFNSKVADAQLVGEFNLYHSSVTQKLWSVDYYNRQISALDINNFRTFADASATLTSGTAQVLRPMDPVIEYLRHLNLFIDGFFMNSMSVLDTLAHELFALYSSPKAKSDIYINTAYVMISTSHSASETKKVLDSQLMPGGWFTEFEKYRHCTIHESLILYDHIQLSVDPLNFTYCLNQPVKLPDNPQVRPLTYNLNRNVVDYCLSTFQTIESLVSSIYDSTLLDIHAKGDILPIP
jgi:hypothetical protein